MQFLYCVKQCYFCCFRHSFSLGKHWKCWSDETVKKIWFQKKEHKKANLQDSPKIFFFIFFVIDDETIWDDKSSYKSLFKSHFNEVASHYDKSLFKKIRFCGYSKTGSERWLKCWPSLVFLHAKRITKAWLASSGGYSAVGLSFFDSPLKGTYHFCKC